MRLGAGGGVEGVKREGGLVKTCPWDKALRLVRRALAHTRPLLWKRLFPLVSPVVHLTQSGRLRLCFSRRRRWARGRDSMGGNVTYAARRTDFHSLFVLQKRCCKMREGYGVDVI